MTALQLSLVCCLLLGVAYGYPDYSSLIPNGNRVFHLGALWPGVGHTLRNGGGPLNSFGIDFRNNNYVWNVTLCAKDSDGDRRTNGEELGDPNCTWSIGQPDPSGTTTHPGFRTTGASRQ
ncbi:temptin-like [Biomphalaria glabrata]|uniref:Temptin-like n=1 Tax=Biomphalaria glabrata TaxID=6526 RepID=A0A9W3AM75_BIOGL|nr:temptin-like [Biomphalaria glabrata]